MNGINVFSKDMGIQEKEIKGLLELKLYELKNPSTQKRVAPFWSWNDNLVEEELIRQIEEMKKQGYGGFFMHSRVGLVTGYLSDKWMYLIKKCAEKAEELKMDAWLYDEDKWPSGFAGGIVPLQKEEHREKGVVFVSVDELEETDKVIKTIMVNSETKYIAIRITKMGNQWFNLSTYIDTMSEEAVKAFLNSTHEKYAEKLGGYFGKSIKGIFTDEPCTNMYCFYNIPFVPWSQNIEVEFKTRKGYSITDKIEELFVDIYDYQKTRYDFYDCISSMFLENFTIQYAKWCGDNKLKLTGHYTSEENLIEQTAWMGYVMPHYEYEHIPGVDKLFNNQDQTITLKQLTSVTEQLDKEQALCECFAGIGHDSGFITRKWIADWQAVNGINFVNPHLSLYSMRGERKRDYPPNLFYQQPWWDDERFFADYIARLCELVSEGKRSVRVLVIHPISSAWCEFNPTQRLKGYPKVNERYNKPFMELSQKLFDHRIDYHFGDEIIISGHGSVEDGKFIVGEHIYDTVIIPPSCNLREKTYQLLKDFGKKGGKLITLLDTPNRIDGNLAQVELSETYHASSIDDLIAKLYAEGYSEVEVIDIHTNTISKKVIASVRDTKEHESIIIIANTDRKREINAKIKIKRNGVPTLISLNDGKMYRVPYSIRDNNIIIKTILIPVGSLALYISKEEPSSVCDINETMGIMKDGSVFEVKNPHEIMKLSISDTEVLERNVLPLSMITLSVNNEIVADNEHLSKITHFKYYTLKDGTDFTATYRFSVHNVPKGDIFAAIEVAENLDEITINGVIVKAHRKKGEACVFDDKAWLDVNFSKVDMTGFIKSGINEIVIKGKKLNNIIGVGSHVGVKDFENYKPTEVETIYIVGNFKVYDIDREEFYIDIDDNIVNGVDVVKSGYPFYSGKLLYKANCVLPNSSAVLLKLSGYHGTSARCYANDKLVGTTGFSPYIFDLTEFAGKDVKIEIVTSNDLYNLMGPAYLSELKTLPWVDLGVFNDAAQYTKHLNLNPYGVDGLYLLYY